DPARAVRSGRAVPRTLRPDARGSRDRCRPRGGCYGWPRDAGERRGVSAAPRGAAVDYKRGGGGSMGRWFRRGVLIAIDGFVVLTAVLGGVAFAVGAEATRFSIEWLVGTPFSSYVLPGLILAVIVGGSASLATAAMLRRWPAATRASVVAGA